MENLFKDTGSNSFRNGPDDKGRFGDYGGRFVSETLMPLIIELEKSYQELKKDDDFWKEYEDLLNNYVGRPSPMYFAERLTSYLNGPKIYFKRDELNHTGAHKINNVIGQILLAKRMGKKRIIAETGAGQPVDQCTQTDHRGTHPTHTQLRAVTAGLLLPCQRYRHGH
mgnify:CR=1 FL=1